MFLSGVRNKENCDFGSRHPIPRAGSFRLLVNQHKRLLEMPASKILVVDDSRTVRNAVKRVLIGAGYEVICASDGHEALERLEAGPDLMVLDINMPGLDGYGVCEQLEARGRQSQDLPIVFLTSNDSHALELLGEQYGAYLQKPVEPDELLRVVGRQLSLTSNATTSG
jgi:CheY-like chemotaxis protein